MTALINYDASNGVVLTETGLSLPETLTLDQWAALGPDLLRAARSSLWWVGDWIRYAERRQDRPDWGKKYLEAVELTGLAPQTLANAVWVCQQVDPSRRREELPWSHHAEVAKLDPELQAELLADAAAERLSVRDLRDRVREKSSPEEKPSGDRPKSRPRCAHQNCKVEEIEGAPLPICETHLTEVIQWANSRA